MDERFVFIERRFRCWGIFFLKGGMFMTNGSIDIYIYTLPRVSERSRKNLLEKSEIYTLIKLNCMPGKDFCTLLYVNWWQIFDQALFR